MTFQSDGKPAARRQEKNPRSSHRRMRRTALGLAHKNVSHFTITGVRSGTIVLPSGMPSATQKYGISIGSGGSADYFVVTGNNLTGNVTGGLNDGSSGTNKVVANNLN